MSAISATDGPVAVTGCSGFTGGHMVRELVLHGYSVRACIRDASSWRGQDCVQYLSRLPNVEIVDGCDLFAQGSYHEAFKGCSGVFHVAAVLGNSADGKSQPKGSGDRQDDVYNGGMAGTQNVIDAVNASGSVQRVVYTSSMSAVSGSRGGDMPEGYEWTETDWASDGVDPEQWQHPGNAYAHGKVDVEHFINEASDASDSWDAITMNPAMICGPILFKAQIGQWVEQLGRIASGLDLTWPKYDMNYNIIDVRDLVKGHRLAAESTADHKASHGGSRYIMHGSGGRSVVRMSTDVTEIILDHFPSFKVGELATVNDNGEPIDLEVKIVNDSKKAKAVLGATFRSIEETIRDLIEAQIELGVIKPQIQD
jgi:nucleoside-diphosphate-sugar epimerase